jgi:tetratricopeptide (TPR) repeat protein
VFKPCRENTPPVSNESGRITLKWFQRIFDQNSVQQSDPPPVQSVLSRRSTSFVQDADALIHRANKRASGGDILGALSDFEEAIHCNPARATAYYNRGVLHNTLGNFEAAIEDLNQALEFLPDYDEAYYQRGNAFSHLQKLDLAKWDFSCAIQLNPYSIKSYYKRAEISAELGDIPEALSDYSQVISRLPKDANAYHHRGVFLAKIGELPAAIQDFSSAIAHNVRYSEAYCSRGCCYAQLGQMAQARQDFSQALSLNPSSQAAYYQRIYGLELMADSEFDPSEPPGTNGLQHSTHQVEPFIQPSQPPISSDIVQEPDLHDYFARANQRAMEGDGEGALQDYTKIIEQDPSNTQAYYYRGKTLNSLGYKAEAMADFEQAIHWARRHSLGLLRDFSGSLSDTIATLKTELSQPKLPKPRSSGQTAIEETITACSRTIEKDPENADAYFRRGQSRALMGDLKGAIADYTKTLQLKPNHGEAYYRRALNRSALGDKIAATQDLQQAMLHRPKRSGLEHTPSITKGTSLAVQIRTDAPQAVLQKYISRAQGSIPDCDHRGNQPGNRFCIHCGSTLSP